MIVPGVLNGSRGPLYYPPEEVQKNPGVWNGVPVVVYHPTDSQGNPESALNNPEVWKRQGVGWVRNDRFKNGKRVGEVWFDLRRVANYDRKLEAQGKPTILPDRKSVV